MPRDRWTFEVPADAAVRLRPGARVTRVRDEMRRYQPPRPVLHGNGDGVDPWGILDFDSPEGTRARRQPCRSHEHCWHSDYDSRLGFIAPWGCPNCQGMYAHQWDARMCCGVNPTGVAHPYDEDAEPV